MYLFSSSPNASDDLKELAQNAEQQLRRVGSLLLKTLELYGKLEERSFGHSDDSGRCSLR
jgi:hypothetical protein